MGFMDILLHPASLAAAAGIITFVFMKLDCKVSAEERKTSAYCKNIILVSGLVGATAYLLKTFAFGGSNFMKGGARPSTIILEDVSLGEPDF